MLYALGAFFLSHLFYTICFATNMTITFYWLIPLTLLIIGAVTIAVIWSQLVTLHWPICTLISMTLVMTWGGRRAICVPSQRRQLQADRRCKPAATSEYHLVRQPYRRRFRANSAIADACYFAGHFISARSLWLI